MRRIASRQLIRFLCGVLGVVFLLPAASAQSNKEHPYKQSTVDISVSLGVGTVRTPQFPVTTEWYDIMIQVAKPLPFRQMQCMMGVTTGPLASKDCSTDDPLLQADWAVWDGEHLVDQGRTPSRCDCKFANKYIFKFLGSFVGERGKKYIVEVKFTKDGTRLNVAN